MGIFGLWAFIRKKLFDPVEKHVRTDPTAGSLYPVIRNAYTFHPMEVAHGIVEQAIRRLVHPTKFMVYIDGAPQKSKEPTTTKGKVLAKRLLRKVSKSCKNWKSEYKATASPRNNSSVQWKKSIRQSFQWSTKERDSLASHLESKGFSVLVCPTEADVQITKDCQPSDRHIWRQRSPSLLKRQYRVIKTKLLVYNI
ncbi:MAG: hypothetical protein J3Q66DRAFT_403029 [Benniella sp.]|nr:MAG: hypothetical protein J3Q66DRAFT_403029 [Benniella sp.]